MSDYGKCKTCYWLEKKDEICMHDYSVSDRVVDVEPDTDRCSHWEDSRRCATCKHWEWNHRQRGRCKKENITTAASDICSPGYEVES